MKYLKAITMLPLSFLLLMLLALPAMAADKYEINGNLNDWGVTLQTAYGSETGLIPTINTVDWIVENNIDSRYKDNNDPSYPDHTGYSATGTHKKGTGSTSVIFEEPKLYHPDSWSNSNNRGGFYLQPSGGEYYDIEAMYFDDDAQNVYIAIVTSMPKGGINGVEAGDIAIDFDQKETFSEYGYEYGIKTHPDTEKGQIIYNPKWTLPQSNIGFIGSAPSKCEFKTGSSYKDPATLVYVNTGVKDNGLDNWVIEAKIPKSSLGYPSAGQTSNVHVTIGCGNDEIELIPVTFKTNIPEFPSIALPVAAIMGVILILGRRNKE